MSNWGIVSTSSPTSGDVVTLNEIKKHLEIGSSETAHDAALAVMQDAAVNWWETETRCHLLARTFVLGTDGFPADDCPIFLPYYPVSAVSAITYDDSDGDDNALATTVYTLSLHTLPPRVGLKYDQVWPVTKTEINTVAITMTTGYGTASDVPTAIKQALLMLVAHWFENRETIVVGTISSDLPLSVEAIVDQYKMGDAYYGVQ